MGRLAIARAALLGACLVAGGCFEAVPTRVLTTWELESDHVHEVVTLPRHLGHGLDEAPRPYRLRARVELDEAWRGQAVVLAVPFMATSLTLKVDGHEVPYLDEHVLERERVLTSHRFRINPSDTTDGHLELELGVANFWALATFWDLAPRLSRSLYGDRWTRFVGAWNVVTACLSLIALLTLALVFWSRHLGERFGVGRRVGPADRNAEFAKTAGGAALYPMVFLGVLQPLIGHRDIAYFILMVLITTKASVQQMRGYAGVRPLPRWSSWAILASAIAFPALAGGYLTRGWIAATVLALFAVIVATVGNTLRHLRGAFRAELTWFVVAWIAILLIGMSDIATVLGFGQWAGGVQLISFAMLIFVTAQAAVLGRDHTRLLLEQGALNRELERRIGETEARNREIEVLNAELRRKVVDRSRELSAALRKARGEAEEELVAGALLGEHYRVTDKLGAGGMGVVYRVERLSDGRTLAAKVVRGRPRPDTLERFTREAELAARIDHPNVVRVLDVDVTADGEIFLVMELVEGRSLEDERARFGDPAFAAVVISQMASALAAIHEGGVVHRDLKPANVLVSVDGGICVKVADFGIAGFRDGAAPTITVGAVTPAASEDEVALGETVDAPPSNPRLTQTGALLGTPLYMAPEVLRGAAQVGGAADLFSLGLIAYQVCGGPVFDRKGAEIIGLRPFTEMAPGLPSDALKLLAACLAEDPARRPTARAVADAFATVSRRAAG